MKTNLFLKFIILFNYGNMGHEQGNRNSENIETIKSVGEIQTEIQSKILELRTIDPQNEKLSIIQEEARIFQNNPDALVFINNSLKKATGEVNEIGNVGNEKRRQITTKMIAKLELYEKTKELKNLDFNA